LKETSVKNFSESELYKKAGFRKAGDFSKRAKFKKSSTETISMYAKNKGRAGSENKYELPPPVDKELYFGSLVLVLHDNNEVTEDSVKDLTCEDWKKIREKLFGGFIDLDNEEEESSEEEIPEEYRTKQGYSKKDGFVVDDDEEEEDEDYVLEEDEEDSAVSTDDEEDDGDIGSNVDDDEEDEEEEDNDEEEEEGEDYGSELSEEEYD
jgi:hypothetical protein